MFERPLTMEAKARVEEAGKGREDREHNNGRGISQGPSAR